MPGPDRNLAQKSKHEMPGFVRKALDKPISIAFQETELSSAIEQLGKAFPAAATAQHRSMDGCPQRLVELLS